MAKSKKTETANQKSASPANSPAKKSAASAKGKSSGPAAKGGSSMPMIDTNLAAQAAAKMFSAGRPARGSSAAPASGQPQGAQPQSAMFKQMKDSLSKPHLSGMNSVLDKSAPQGTKRPNLPGGRNEQIGHNQTFGADVNRAGVPRRTPG